MTKLEFDGKIRQKLESEGVSGADADWLLAYYNKLFAKRMGDGGDETDIIADFGTVDEIVANYITEMGLSPIGKFVKDKKQVTASWVQGHTDFLHNRTFWLVYFCGFIITFPLTIALFGVLMGLLGAVIGAFFAILALYISMYAVSLALLIYGILGLFTFLFDMPWHFAEGSVVIGIYLAAIGLGLLFIALTIFTQKQINKLFRKNKRGA